MRENEYDEISGCFCFSFAQQFSFYFSFHLFFSLLCRAVD